MKKIQKNAALAAALVLAASGAACGTAEEEGNEAADPAVSLALSTVSTKMSEGTTGATVMNALRAGRSSSSLGFACTASATAMTGCETELTDFSQKLMYTPSDFFSPSSKSTYSDNFLYIYKNNLMLACAAIVGLEGEATLDSKGYPENGSYEIAITEGVVENLVDLCGVPEEMASTLVDQFGQAGITFNTVVADTADDSNYDKAITVDVTDGVSTKIEMLVSYSAAGAKIFMKQQYKNDCCGDSGLNFNSSDIWVADFDKDSGITRFEFVSPNQSSWTSGSSRMIRLMVDETAGTVRGMQHFKANGDIGTYTFAADATAIALSMKGKFQSVSALSSAPWVNGKKACVNPAGTTVLTGKDDTVSCGAISGADLTGTPAAGTTALLTAAEALSVSITDTDTVCPVDETDVADFTASDFFTAGLSICN